MNNIHIANADEGECYLTPDENWEDLVEFEKIQDPRVLKAAPAIEKGPRKIRRLKS